MDQEQITKEIVEEVMKAMMQEKASANKVVTKAETSNTSTNRIDSTSYPLSEKIPEKVYSRTGKKLSEIKLEDVMNGKLKSEDLRVSPETMEMQAQVAESIKRETLAGNLRRAAELIDVPDKRLLEIYNALRPYRSSKQELIDIANELDNKYNCTTCSALVRDAANVYEQRDRLRQD
ncbi:MAG: diol dehydratase small subunit [Peptostreptococcaceae bacterium]|nr:diol dehydratase small subunit [Peptostreptococcaceae bacterium]